MPGLALSPTLAKVDLSTAGGPSDATVVIVGLPKKNVGIVFGQRTAQWLQRYNTYLLNTDNIVINPQALWDAPSDNGRFLISQIVPPGAAEDPSVLCMGPYTEDRNIAVYCSHKKAGSGSFVESDTKHSFHEFKIGSKTAIAFTMVNAEDGGDSDYHDTVVGVAVASLSINNGDYKTLLADFSSSSTSRRASNIGPSSSGVNVIFSDPKKDGTTYC
ncbi:hypothetical protein CPB84DRAFT_1964201 [Gymnopilus junonius]|uniref:Uncharacterized protein n=1 Tax=Gymnopilus junonius TaxID=109634 RepID=A0A9P5NJD3_GYMJU|nr:hypothetical protein CPB84DRAFT_1964201 [Gymnopilus junonius]